jgi:hypothetical protein
MKLIPLTQGQFAIVDDEDFESLSAYKWCYSKGYAVRNRNAAEKAARGGKRGLIPMHRQIMNPPDDMDVDHKHGDTLDNRRSELRVCPHAKNQANQKIRSGKKAKYKGVHRVGNKWCAQIGSGPNRKRHLGMFDSQEEAALAYNAAAFKQFGEFARLNDVNT